MRFTHFKSSYKSSDGVHTIMYSVFFPVGEVKGIVQLAHGMCEYADRYADLCRFLANSGYLVCGNDHLGHGYSVSDDSELGWIAEERGWEHMVEDMYTLTAIIKKSYPDKPFFLLGHSMGSFLVRAYMVRHSKGINGVFICGTSAGVDGLSNLLAFNDMLIKIHGDKYRSKLINKMALGLFNAKIKDKHSDYEWVSTKRTAAKDMEDNRKCNFIFTLNGFDNLGKLLWYVSNEKWYEAYPKDIPTYLLSGENDPVGAYGKGVTRVYSGLKRKGCNVTMKLYENARHELVNEWNKEEFYDDILEHLSEYV